MFNNISGKIKLIAKILFWVGIIFFGGLGIVFIFSGAITDDVEQIQLAIMAILMGLVSYVFSCLVYGFAQLIENTNSLNGVQVIQDEQEKQHKNTTESEDEKNKAIVKELAAWYISAFEEDEERIKAIKEFIEKN